MKSTIWVKYRFLITILFVIILLTVFVITDLGQAIAQALPTDTPPS
jgi:hypothetical protein